MDLKVKNIELLNFRNYKNLQLSDLESLVIFLGPNAIGKTNIIEAIQLLTALDSFKKTPASQLIFWDETLSQIGADITNNERLLNIKMSINDGKKTYFLNNKRKQKKELKSILPAVVFSPDDLVLIKGSQSRRRNAIDDIGIQISANYRIIKNDYDKIILHKNKLLKTGENLPLLDSINETLLTVGSKLYCYRSSLFFRLRPFIKNNYIKISEGKETLETSYTPSWEIYNEEIYQDFLYDIKEVSLLLFDALNKNKQEEIRRKKSLIGPHADKIDFYISGKNSGLYGSQGQQRSLVLSFKLAEVEIIQEIIKQKPVLLLDDVMSELDTSRRRALMSFIEDGIQTFITTTHINYFSSDIINNAQILNLENIEKL